MSKSFQIEQYFNFKTCIKPDFNCLYVSYWRKDIRQAQGISLDYKKFLAKRIEGLLTNEFCTMCELNALQANKSGFLSWVITKERTYIFRRPNDNYLEIAILKEKVSDFGNYVPFLKSIQLVEVLTELCNKASFAFAHYKGVYKWNNTLKY
jgi:hypothetical protein